MVDVGEIKLSPSTFSEGLDLEEPHIAPPLDRKSSVPSGPAMSSNFDEDEEEEDLADYKQDGYHPVRLGDIFNERYQVVRKLGWGHFSTVWLARVLDSPSKKHVALKIMRSAAHYTEAAWDEIEVLQKVKTTDKSHPGYNHVVTIEDSFVHKGPHGSHMCMVFEVLGASLLSLVRRFNQNGIPEVIVKQIAKQVCLGLDYLHRVCGVIHTDLKPENILIDVPGLDEIIEREAAAVAADPSHGVIISSQPLGHNLPYTSSSQINVKIADLGNGCWCHKHFSNDIQTREYRAPEIIVGSRWGAGVDMWSLACMVFELLTGDYLFEPQAGTRFSKNDDHIAQIIELLGPLPLSLLIQGQLTQLYFHQDGHLRNISRLEEWSLCGVFVDKYGYSPEHGEALCDFLLPMLSTNPLKRADAGGMTNHPWVKDAAPQATVERPTKGSGENIPGWVLKE